MDGILLINKEKGVTSRDVVNQISKKLNLKKVGHAGTLDPLATGLLVIGIGRGTKILELLTLDTKEYIATVKMGIKTNTLDISGEIEEEKDNFSITKLELEKALNNFKGTYYQEVPKYSAVKINGKKLYEYAREQKNIELPKRLVEIKEIELLNFDIKNKEFIFKTLVSKGTYIRSLIADIGAFLDIPCTMKELNRTKSGKFLLSDSLKVNDTALNIIPISKALDFKIVSINEEMLLKKIRNGNTISLPSIKEKYIILTDSKGVELAIYKENENGEFKAFKVF